MHISAVIKYQERKIRSVKELKGVIEGLDPDEGLRIIGSIQGLNTDAFIFVTKPSEKFCVNVCEQVRDKNLKAMVPGGREEWLYASTPDEVWGLIETRIKKPLNAWLY